MRCRCFESCPCARACARASSNHNTSRYADSGINDVTGHVLLLWFWALGCKTCNSCTDGDAGDNCLLMRTFDRCFLIADCSSDTRPSSLVRIPSMYVQTKKNAFFFPSQVLSFSLRSSLYEKFFTHVLKFSFCLFSLFPRISLFFFFILV